MAGTKDLPALRAYRAWMIITMTSALPTLLLLLCITLQSTAFAPLSRSKINNTLLASSSPIGDLFSGITGVAPSSLDPPLDVLSGTSIDSDRDDVSLGRVYKVRQRFYDAIKCERPWNIR